VETAVRLGEEGFRHAGSQPGFLYGSLWAVYRITEPILPALANLRLPAGHSLTGEGQIAPRLWLGRLWLDVLSAATVLVVFYLSNTLAGPGAGLVAAILLAVNPLSIAAANYLKEDTPLALWLACTALASLALSRSPSARNALLSGVCAGLAAGSKYTGAFAAALAAAALIQIREREPGSQQPRRGQLVAWTVGGAILALAASTPSLLLAPTEIARGIRYQAQYATTGHHDGISLPLTDTLGVLYLREALLPSLGTPALLVTLVGLAALWKRDRTGAVVLALASLAFLAVVEVLPAKPYPFFARYALPAMAPLCALAGIGTSVSATHLSAVFPRYKRALHCAVVLLVLGLPVVRGIRFVWSMYPDTRDEAADWLVEHVPAGSVVMTTPYGLLLPRGRYWVQMIDSEAGVRKILERQRQPVSIVLSSFTTQRFAENPKDNPPVTQLYRWLESEAHEVATFSPTGPRFGFYNPSIRILQSSPAPTSERRSSSNPANAPTASTESTRR